MNTTASATGPRPAAASHPLDNQPDRIIIPVDEYSGMQVATRIIARLFLCAVALFAVFGVVCAGFLVYLYLSAHR